MEVTGRWYFGACDYCGQGYSIGMEHEPWPYGLCPSCAVTKAECDFAREAILQVEETGLDLSATIHSLSEWAREKLGEDPQGFKAWVEK